MELFEAIRTTRAMRRLDPEQDVTDEDVRTILEAALKGPTGGNQQPIRWLVIRDPDIKKRLQKIYQRCWNRGRKPYEDEPGKVAPNVLSSADHLAENLHLAPVIILACADTGAADKRHHASVYPSVQNLLLAARALGLGTALTTAHLFEEDAVKEVLGIPEHATTYALIPVGHPTGKWGEAKRRPLDEVSYHDRWGQRGPSATTAS
ncbi:nitroreductase [Nocardioides marinisabuli]|uniref:Nitroreductase n=1 Tax=Nocardioides marinisabuli TaxID=419476 RepID=A0A7Y9F0N0_9ACTN|nr:nitroreductase family protein [Nocardioides marinisabuli]NYD57196.1 nitroreductase [Nocardioides marinisabuli]